MDAMEAKSVAALPVGATWQYEPKWDGFRCLLQRRGGAISLTSKSGQDLARYFPEVADAAVELPERTFLLDGELVIPQGKHLSFDSLLQRIHPAKSRVAKLSVETPARYLAFDLLKRGRTDLARQDLSFRRPALVEFAERCFANTLFVLSPASLNIADAKRWLKAAGGGSDGVVAKRLDLPYQSGNREGMQKVKLIRSADCVIGGFRYAETMIGKRKVVGSLLLGLYDGSELHHVGFTSGLKASEKPGLTDRLEAMVGEASFTGKIPGGPSRWSTKRSGLWVPVVPRLVVEVSYDHFTGGRFRHGTAIMRWRSDKRPDQCTMDQLHQKSILPDRLFRQM